MWRKGINVAAIRVAAIRLDHSRNLAFAARPVICQPAKCAREMDVETKTADGALTRGDRSFLIWAGCQHAFGAG